MIKALVYVNDILLKQPLVTTGLEIQVFVFNRFILDKPDHNSFDRSGCLQNHAPKHERLVTLWWGWFTGITLLGMAAPVFAVQLEANDTTADIRSSTAIRPAGAAIFPTSPMLVSQVSSDLRFGSTGAAVIDLQNRLAALGYYQGEIDGDFGSQTEEAVRQFQRAQGLTSDGVVGQQTASALSRSGTRGTGLNSGSAISPGRFSIGELQRRLQSRGFYQGPIDGVSGPGTRAAIAAAQRAYGVTENDILNGGF